MTLYLFVYGSLRKGMTIHGYIRSMTGHPEPPLDPIMGTAQGTMYSFGAYPIVDFDGAGTIVGELYPIPPDRDSYEYETFRCLSAMEQGAGYVPRVVTVTTDEGEVDAISFHYPRSPAGLVEVHDGDWANHTPGPGEGFGYFA